MTHTNTHTARLCPVERKESKRSKNFQFHCKGVLIPSLEILPSLLMSQLLPEISLPCVLEHRLLHRWWFSSKVGTVTMPQHVGEAVIFVIIAGFTSDSGKVTDFSNVVLWGLYCGGGG